jgi:hypothetical protein
MRRSVFACGLLLVLAGIPSVVSTAAGGTAREPTVAQHEARAARTDAHSAAYWSGEVRRARAVTAHWLTVVRGRPPRHSAAAYTSSSPGAARNLARIWHRRAKAASRLAHHPPKLKIWYCIHHYEGSWTDPNAPYWGGLQMDYSFQDAYGAWLLKHKGTANHWAPLAQIWAGVRAWRVRGFAPWSNTAHACGAY